MLHTPKPYAVTRPHPLAFQMWQSPSLPAGQEATWRWKQERESIFIQDAAPLKEKNFFYHKATKNCAGLYNNYNNRLLTHPVSGAQVGTRLHKSLMSRITTTAEFRSLTLAWRHKQKPVKSEELLFLTPKTKHGKVRTSLIQMISHFSPRAVCLSTETTFQTEVELILRELSLTEDILMNQIICCSQYQWFLQISHWYGSVDHYSWLNNSNLWHFKGDLLCISLFQFFSNNNLTLMLLWLHSVITKSHDG